MMIALTSTGRNRQGFTLIETILYIAISAVVVVSLLNIMVAVLQTRQKAGIGTEVQQNLRYAMDRITLAARSAVGLNTGTSVFGSANGTLSLAMSGSTVNPTVFTLCGTQVCIKEGSSSSAPITGTGVIVDQFQFTNLSAPTFPETVKIVLHGKQPAANTVQTAQSNLTLETSISLRQ